MKFLFLFTTRLIQSLNNKCLLIVIVIAFSTQAYGNSTIGAKTPSKATPSSFQRQCSDPALSASHLIAEYEIVKHEIVKHEIVKSGASSNKLIQAIQLILVRNSNEVAHQYPQTGITESWQLNHAEQIKSVRFFDKHARVIEYQPNERVHGKTETDWSYRNQLISDSLLNKFTTTKVSNEDCNRLESKTYTNRQITMDLTWFSELRIVNTFSIKDKQSGTTLESWSLQSIQLSSDQIIPFFNTRHAYLATDFADIGDDHTDPFLTNMTNLGFIESGALGFMILKETP
ncbi:hypothetical protein [Brumicola pallidula]|uniref:Uncharacterized protein n=1 Tax=Brumicola pallidula DSM 14239 = ACAM 615 TaxID=1121922 RepID=K6ZKR1_9ALTE|nr:hypothetical protein [Glaciecola pallidula]GAC29478.1 hypothetical protein GPAL_2624 [Glaciecola pallidula DSM 14239 = ACAM 615]